MRKHRIITGLAALLMIVGCSKEDHPADLTIGYREITGDLIEVSIKAEDKDRLERAIYTITWIKNNQEETYTKRVMLKGTKQKIRFRLPSNQGVCYKIKCAVLDKLGYSAKNEATISIDNGCK